LCRYKHPFNGCPFPKQHSTQSTQYRPLKFESSRLSLYGDTADAVRSVSTTLTVDDSCVMWLNCWSDGNPAAQYSWFEWTDHRRTPGRVYRADCECGRSGGVAISEPTDLTLQCYATNVVSQRSYVAASSNVTLNLTADAPCLRTYSHGVFMRNSVSTKKQSQILLAYRHQTATKF